MISPNIFIGAKLPKKPSTEKTITAILADFLPFFRFLAIKKLTTAKANNNNPIIKTSGPKNKLLIPKNLGISNKKLFGILKNAKMPTIPDKSKIIEIM